MPFVEEGQTKIVPIWINGSALPIDQERLIEVNSSRQAQVVHYAQGASVDAAQAAANAAGQAFLSWRRTKYNTRRDLLLKVADIFERRADEVVACQTTETSCTETYARFNIKLACELVREFAASIVQALSGSIPPIPGEGHGLVVKEPIGPVLLIPPWNSSIILSTRGIAGAIAAGCTVVLKASEACPRTHNIIVDIFEEAGLPAGCINQVQASRGDAAALTEALISHPAIRKIEFIGSAGVGSQIAKVAAVYLKPVLMELGGKGPALVLKDADLKKAAKCCAFGAFLHHGQICFSTERIIVEKAVADEFTDLLKQEVSLYARNTREAAFSLQGASHAHDVVQQALDNGATLVAGDNSYLGANSVSVTPTIITNVNATHKIYDEETFGPSASLYVVEDEAAAVTLANASAYGLSASIHTKDYMRAISLARDLDYGQVNVNTTTVYDQPTLPVSGTKRSGWGNNNARYGLAEYLQDKTITLHTPEEPLAFGE